MVLSTRSPFGAYPWKGSGSPGTAGSSARHLYLIHREEVEHKVLLHLRAQGGLGAFPAPRFSLRPRFSQGMGGDKAAAVLGSAWIFFTVFARLTRGREALRQQKPRDGMG